MENDLVSLYESNYLRGRLVQENTKPDYLDLDKDGNKTESMKKAAKDAEHDSDEDEDEDETHDEAVKRKFKKSNKKSMKTKSKKPVNAGEIYGDSFQRSENIFDQILREMDEMGGNYDSSSMEESDDVFGASDTSDEGEQTFTLSELRSMTLSQLAALLEGEDEGEEKEDYSFEDENYDEGEVPSESYGFTGGEGNYKGDQGNYDGKAKKQAPTSHVKANGDADFGKADTGFDPEDTEGSEGSFLGDQDEYDGKAKKQAPSSHVKANGDADFGKAKTGYKTNSGKKDKNYF
jgi:hypothetical protein